MSDSLTDTASPLILLAEDHAELRGDIRDELREAGYAVIEASDGEETLAQIQAAVPDLILCDISMPGCNGYEVLRVIRDTRPDLADTPFVFLSALSDTREVIEGKRLGADDYLIKPIDFDLMLATLDARLRQVGRMRHKVAKEIDELRQAMSGLHQQASQQAFQAATRALDLVAPGMVLLDENGSVLFANRAAQQLADTTPGLSLEARLATSSPGDRQSLRHTLRMSLAASRDGEERVDCLRLSRPGKRRDLLVLVCSLSRDTAQPGKEPVTVVMLSDPEKRAHVSRQVLARLFGLTPTEARIALALTEGQRSDEIAERMAVSPTTVAFHLRNLFQKTDTHRQADLIALVLSGSMAVSLE